MTKGNPGRYKLVRDFRVEETYCHYIDAEASLPVTGFLIWWWKKKPDRKPASFEKT
ncbi:MAG TPA: hypothetical protein VG738_08010 [Chitinophagaceae bacterium]|nr:hypothetical protein [Chitinophagaceae bacterium]